MSLSINSERSDHEPASHAGLRSPLYGTATFTTLSPSPSPAPLSPTGGSSSRLTPPSRSVTPLSSNGGTRTRYRAGSPTESSYDSRGEGNSASDPDFYDNDNSIDETAEVEEVLSIEDEGSSGGSYSTALSGSAQSSGTGTLSAAGLYGAHSDSLDYDRERRALSALSERTETHSLSPGAGASPGLFQNLFASTFQRPTLFSAARSLYGGPTSPISPPNVAALQGSRPSTPTFRPAPPTGRRVGNLIASFESSATDSDLPASGHTRLASAPAGPRSPSPYSASSRSSSPVKHSRYGSTGFSLAERTSSPSLSSFLSPPQGATTYSRTSVTRSSDTGTATERPRSPLHSVRNIVSAWRDRAPEKTSTEKSESVAEGPSITNTSASSTHIEFGDGIFSLRRRAGLASTSQSGDGRSEYSSFGETRSGVTASTSLARSSSQRSAGGSSIFDMSELGSFIRENRDPLRVGQLWYLNVHAPPPFQWQRCRAMLYPNILLLTWLAPGGGRGVVTLDLINCNEVRSVPSPSHPTARDDIGTIAARLQMDSPASEDLGDYDLLEMLCPFQLLYTDGIERLGAESARERVRWVSAIWEALDHSVAPPDRSMTRSPTGSIRTIRSITSAISSGSGSGSASTSFMPPTETIPDLPDFDSLSQSESSRQTLSSLTSYARTRATDDGAISTRGGLLHPYSASIEIAPSRSSSLRRTSSLADLDAEFASALSASGIEPGIRSRPRGTSSRFSARWTREPSEHGSSAGSGSAQTRRVRASTFYSLSGGSDPTLGAFETSSSTLAPTQGLYSSYSSETGTEVVPSTLSLRGSASNSLLGDSHSGPTTTIYSSTRSPTTTPTRSRTAETLSTSGTGLSRASAVRRRTPRGARSTQSTSDKENEYEESYTVEKTSHFSTLEGDYSYTTTSYDEYTRSRALSESGISTRPDIAPAEMAESESEEDVFHTPTPSARTGTSYHSAPGTPTPSVPSLPPTEYETAYKAPSTEFVTADVCSSDMLSTAYTTAEVCPSTPPITETEYITAQCNCKPVEPSIPEEISALTPSLSLQKLDSIKEAEVPLPESETEESPPISLKDLTPLPLPEPSLTPSTVSTLPETKLPEAPTPSLSVSSTTIDTTTSITPTTVSDVQPAISSPTSPSSPSSPLSIRTKSLATPKSKSLYVPSQSSHKSESDNSDYEHSFLLPSPSLQSVSFAEQPMDESFETSFLRPGMSEVYSMTSSPFMPKALPDFSTTGTPDSTSVGPTSSMESLPRLPEKPVILQPKELTEPSTPSSISTPSSLSFTTEDSLEISSLTPSSILRSESGVRSARSATPRSLTPSSVVRPELDVAPARSATPSSVTPFSGLRTESAMSSAGRTVTPSSLAPSSAMRSDTPSAVARSLAPSSLTASGPFGDDSILGLGSQATVERSLSTLSTVSAASFDSGIFAPSILDEPLASPSTVPQLLSSRTTTPRPTTPAGVPLPSSPSLSMSSATPTAASISTPRSEPSSLHTITSVVTEDVDVKPREEILTHDVNRLLRYLHDLDQIRGGETQDVKEQLRRIEDEIRDLSDYMHQTPKPERVEYVSPPKREPRPTRVPERVEHAVPSESLTYESVPSLPTAPPIPQETPAQAPAQPRSLSPSYSPSEISEGLSFLPSPHSDDFSLMSLEDYPGIPVSPPGSPSSPSSIGWSSPSSRATLPPSSKTPSTDQRSTILGGSDLLAEDLTLESPVMRIRSPLPAQSPLASLATAESPLPYPPQSTTPSLPEAAVAVPRDLSPLPEGMPGPSPVELGDVSSATFPPSSETPSASDVSSSLILGSTRSPLPLRQPASPVLSLSTEPSEQILSPEPSPEPILSAVPSSPALTVRPATPSDRSRRSRALDGLRDLLEDLRNQTQALWDGQLSTNRMLDDLIDRGQPAAPVPPANEEVLGRLHNIEGLLNSLLRDLDRARLGMDETAPSDISSDTSSALRRYIDRLRRPMPHEPLHMPTPVRAPRPDLDTEWLDFLSQPPVPSDLHIQGPPPLPPLVQRLPRRRRAESISPPPSIPTPVIRTSSAPLDETIRLADQPPYYPRDLRMRPPWMAPRLPAGVRRPARPSESQAYLPSEGYPGSERRPGRPRPQQPPQPEGPDFDAQVRENRRRRQGGDGWIDTTGRPTDDARFSWEEVPPPPSEQPPRVHTAPPGGRVPDSWYRPGGRVRPEQTLGDAAAAPAAPGPAPQQMPGGIPFPPGAVPILQTAYPPTGPPPPFNEMLDLLRQNRLAQTASIDQQREIMRYMRGLNHWLELDVRDRQNEMRGIGARVDALRAELPRLGGLQPGFPPMQPGIPGQPPVQQGPTYIVPPLPQPQPGFVMSPPVGAPVVPMGPMPQPGMMPQAGMPFPSQFGVGPPVIPPLVPPEGFETPGGGFVPPRPPMADIPVVPYGPGYSRPPTRYEPSFTESYDDRPGRGPDFIPPHPQTPMMPVPPPPSHGGPYVIQPPLSQGPIPVQESRSGSPSDESRSRRSHSPPDIHIHVPSAPGTGIPMAPSGPPEVVHMGPPIQPGFSYTSSAQPVPPPGAQPIIIAPPPTSGYPGEFPSHSQAPQVIVQAPHSFSPERPPQVVMMPTQPSEGPTRVVVHSPEYSPSRHRRDYSPRDYGSRSPSPSHRHRRRQGSRSPSYSPRSGRSRRRRDHDDRDEGGRRRSRTRSRSPRSPTVVHMVPPPSQAPVFVPPPFTHAEPPGPTAPIIIQQPGLSETPHAVPSGGAFPPLMVAPQQPQSYPPPSRYADSRGSPSPPYHVPLTAPSQPPVIVHTASDPHRVHESPRRRSRSQTPEHRRGRYSDEDPHRRRASRSPEDPHRRRSRSPEDPHRIRRSRSPEEDRGSRRLRRPRRSSADYSEGDPGDRDYSRHRRHSPSYSRPYEPTEVRYTPSESERRRQRLPEEEYLPSHAPSQVVSGRSRSPRPVYVEGDEGEHRLHRPPTRAGTVEGRPVRAPTMSPTRVVVHTAPSPPPIVIRPHTLAQPPTAPSAVYAPPETVPESPPRVVRPPYAEDMAAPSRVPTRVPSRRSERPPTVVHITPGRDASELYEEEPHMVHPSHPSEYVGPPISEGGRPIPPPQDAASRLRSEILSATETQPIVPLVPSEAGPAVARPGRMPTHRMPSEPVYEHEEGVHHIPESMAEEEVPRVERIPPSRRTPSPTRVVAYPPPPRTPSGPGDLQLQDALHTHQERLEEQERRLEELERAAVEAEDRREDFFRQHEEDRQRIFQENEERREREAAELRDEVREEIRDEVHEEVEQVLRERPTLAAPPPVPPVEEMEGATVVPPPGGVLADEGALPPEATLEGRPETIAPTEFSRVSIAPSAEEAIPVPPPVTTAVAEPLPQLQEILDLLRAQQEESLAQKDAEAERFDALREEIDQARADAQRECEERIRMLEDELARTKEELELEKGQRRQEELERIERERGDILERDEAVRLQLSDITNIVQESREDIIRKRELMDERWAEKERRREEKQGRNDMVYEMLQRIIDEREQERAEREQERAAAAERPSIEHVLEELRRQNEAQIAIINELRDNWREDSARQHQDTIEAVRSTAQEMVPYNLTGYLDEFSKALAGEIRALLGEVGRLHEQKRTLQFEIGSLLHMHSQYGPGGQFEPDWHPPAMGPLAPPPPGPDMPPPPPEEPPQVPPSRPAWRTVQQRGPRRRRTQRGGPEPAPMPPQQQLAPPEPAPEMRQQSWATWQPNLAWGPTPPPPGASPLVVPPPSGPTGLFGPRSPRGTMYGS